MHAEHGITLFLTTHYLEEADALCDRILVIDSGRIVVEGSPDEFKRTVAGDTVTLGTDAPTHTARIAQALPDSTGLAVDGTTVRFRVPRGSTALPLLLSGILLPMSLAPAWLYLMSRFNPFVYVVDATRAAFIGDLTGPTVELGVLSPRWRCRSPRSPSASVPSSGKAPDHSSAPARTISDYRRRRLEQAGRSTSRTGKCARFATLARR